jgi:hypothetical protein
MIAELWAGRACRSGSAIMECHMITELCLGRAGSGGRAIMLAPVITDDHKGEWWAAM